MFWKRKNKTLTEEQIQADLKSRQVDKYKISITLVNGEVVEYITGWRRLNCYANGIHSYKKLILLDKDLTVNGVTYGTSNFIKIEHEHLETRYIKKEIKDYLDTGGILSDWNWKRTAKDDELE